MVGKDKSSSIPTTIFITINNFKTKAIIDTKAPISLIKQTLIDTILKLAEKPIGKRRLHLLQRCGQNATTAVEAVITFENNTYPMKLYVSSQLRDDVILGIDFLRKSKLSMKSIQNKAPLTVTNQVISILGDKKVFDILLLEEDNSSSSSSTSKTADKTKPQHQINTTNYNPIKEEITKTLSEENKNTLLQISSIGNDKIEIDRATKEAINKFPSPRSIKDVALFLKLIKKYRQFIEIYAWQVNPLSDLLKKNEKFNWTNDCEEAFNTIKEMVTNAPKLVQYNPRLLTTFVIDSCAYGISGILSQGGNETKQIVTYSSKTLNRCQRKYPTRDLELFAIVWTVTKFKHLIYGSHFEIRTNRCSLCHLAKIVNPNNRQERWRSILLEYDFTLTDTKGNIHRNIECISREQIKHDSTNLNKTKKEFQKHEATATKRRMPSDRRGPSEIII